jgi:hypothetical protein
MTPWPSTAGADRSGSAVGGSGGVAAPSTSKGAESRRFSTRDGGSCSVEQQLPIFTIEEVLRLGVHAIFNKM